MKNQTIPVLRFRSFARSREFFLNRNFNVVRRNVISGWICNWFRRMIGIVVLFITTHNVGWYPYKFNVFVLYIFFKLVLLKIGGYSLVLSLHRWHDFWRLKRMLFSVELMLHNNYLFDNRKTNLIFWFRCVCTYPNVIRVP